MTTQDADLAAAIHLATQPNYLGNPAVIDQILKDLSVATLDRWHAPVDLNSEADVDAAVQADTEACERAALIFLGRDPAYTPMPGWNRPGMIDEHVAKTLNLADEEPVIRVAFVLRFYLTGMWDVVGPWKKGEVSDERFQRQLMDLVQEYRNMLMGIAKPTG